MKKYISIILLTMVLASCGKTGAKKEKEHIEKPIVVSVLKITPIENSSFIQVSGKVQASNSTELSTRVMGFVNKIHVKIGEEVKKGQLILSIQNNDLLAKKAQVESNILKTTTGFKNAEKDYSRYKKLFASNSISQKEMDDMATRYEMAKASLEGVKQQKSEINAQFAYTNIRAPFSGIITNKYIDQGALANPGMPLISIEGKGDFEVQTLVPEGEISKIKQDIPVLINVKAIDKTFKGKIVELSTSAKNTGGQYLVKLSLKNASNKLLSGMYATVQFPIKETNDTKQKILISNDAIVSYGQLQGVYTVSQSNKALLRWLRLGRSFEEQTEVLSGLSIGESYILSSEGKLYNGAQISIQ